MLADSLESQSLTPDASAAPPSPTGNLHRRRSSLAKLLDLTSPLVRSRTPEPISTAEYFIDPKLPTYGGTLGGSSAVEDEDEEGLSVLLGWDSTPDAQIASEHVLAKMTFKPQDHIYLATILPLATSSFSHHDRVASTPPLASMQEGVETPTSAADQQLMVLRRIRASALERLRVSAQELHKAKGCKVTFLIAHADAPAKSLGSLATLHKTDLIILGRRKLGRLQKVVGAGSVGNWLLDHGYNVLVVQE
ncbi:hypothetical protein BDY24DRAFT_393295 [Mrakia frigida]|uniref:uncharacterized protein n=1 Tax=Mrakia frigida TaxID=29902 RepID=UPI003FCBFFAD